VKIGVIGLGVISQYAHIPAYRYKKLNLYGIADINEDILNETKEKWDIPYATNNPDELINNSEIDVIDIATPPQTHAEFIKKAANAGKHILCQKPLALTVEEASELINICNQNNVKLAVNQNMRWTPQSIWVKNILKSNMIGEPFFVSINYQRYEEYNEWRAKINRLIFWELTIHYLDLIRYWFGEPISVYAQKTFNPSKKLVDTVNVIVLKFKNGLVTSLTNNWASVDRHSKIYNIHVDGSLGAINISKDETYLYSSNSSQSGWLKPDLKAQYNYDGPYPLCLDAFAYSMESLLKAIQNNTEPIVSGNDNLNTIKLVDAACISGEKNTVINL
jgi:predicted dehydrogenase